MSTPPIPSPDQTTATPAARRDVERLLDLGVSYAISRCIQAIADFSIADALGETPATPAELAARTGLHADALGRILRYLATEGIFEDVGGRFRHTALSRVLRSDHPQSQKDYLRVLRLIWPVLEALDHSLRTGRPATDTLAPGGVWEWLRTNPELQAVFDRAMVSYAGSNSAAIVKAYDFSGFRSIADIGGGRGHLLQAILETVPRAEGTLFDQPSVVDAVRANPPARTRIVGGDFFKDPLPRSDAYLLMQVIHDWDDEQSIAILRNVRKATDTRDKLLLIEILLSETPQPGNASYMDFSMLAFIGGRERKRSEYERLLSAAGWRLGRVVPTESFMSILEAAPV